MRCLSRHTSAVESTRDLFHCDECSHRAIDVLSVLQNLHVPDKRTSDLPGMFVPQTIEGAIGPLPLFRDDSSTEDEDSVNAFPAPAQVRPQILMSFDVMSIHSIHVHMSE